ncbi:MAG: T9SS type A sorting domain-containing protein, partial [Bacteroidetes bacterium]|nr:T9SS type A sorting domain-containing protein [Bacteroidota bacterium]
DIQVYWYGNCDMWIDYVRVDNDVADQLFKGYYEEPGRNWIQDEVEQIGLHDHGTGSPVFMKYYMELAEFNNLPCMAYVNSKLKQYSDGQLDLIQDLTNTLSAHVPWRSRTSVENPGFLKRQYIDKVGFTQVFAESYPMSGCYKRSAGNNFYSKIPSTLFGNPGSVNNDSILADIVAPSEYEAWLQDNINHNHYVLEGYEEDNSCEPCQGTTLYQDRGNFRYKMQLSNALSKLADIPFIFMPQAHQWYRPGEVRREPTNEELNMMVNTAVSYGAKGIIYFCYNQFYGESGHPDWYGTGIVEGANNRFIRTKNFYGQNKGDTIQAISVRLKDKWGPYLLSFDNTKTVSAIYDFAEDRANFTANTYFMDIVTYKSGSGLLQCVDDGPGLPGPSGMLYDCKYERYVQAAVFKNKTNDGCQYFMIVNRRCSPYVNESSESNRGGKRKIEIRFHPNASEFNGYNDWVIIDAENDNKIVTFDKRTNPLLDLGDFMPGQGKLYKVVPVAKAGGNLVSDEILSGSLNCNARIFNNGYNVTVNPGASITFSDSAGIEMNGGIFTCGVNADNADAVTLQKSSGGTGWSGLTLNNCTSIGIYNTFINGVKANDTVKSVSMTNCYNAGFRRNTFSQTNNSGAIQVVYTNPSDETLILNIRECNFNMGPSGYSGINIISNASMTTPVVIEWCNFTTSNDTSNAVMLTNVTGGAIKNNNINGFKKSIVALTSAIDIYGNRIIGCNSSSGIQCLSGSDVTIKSVSGYHLGGDNYFRNYGSSSACIYSDNSWFDINTGGNNFDLDNINDSKFLSGTLSGTPADNVNATKSCFHKDSVQNIEGNHNMTWYSSNDPVGFSFAPYTCDLSQNEDFIVFNYGEYNDTVYYNPGGQGSGFNPNKVTNIQEGSYKSLRDTINLNLRKRNYSVVEDKAKQLLTQYPDSLESIGMVQKLYIASLTLDQNGNKIGQLKTFFEGLISSNSQNPALIKRAFYHIQKCKVKLGQYQSALDGFQYIMTQNPYSYEGLVASWDYAATYLLMGQGGSLSGETEQMTEELNTPADTLLYLMSRNDSKTRTTIDGQKTKVFYEKVKIATKDDRTVQEEKIKQLEKTIESSKSDVTKSKAQMELTTMKTIKESVKIKKPNSVKTHVIMINNDIKKIFGIGKGSKTSGVNNVIPKTYELYQNYPNPFNPSTKIAFDLPQDGKVKLVIYDILGRQIKTLVDNELRTAGKYTIEFNGSNLASGIYFYRLQVEGVSKFTAVKKMVLIK